MLAEGSLPMMAADFERQLGTHGAGAIVVLEEREKTLFGYRARVLRAGEVYGGIPKIREGDNALQVFALLRKAYA